MAYKSQDLSGLEFGMLTVMECLGKSKRDMAWLCRCSCGNFKTVDGRHLRDGATKSCGCIVKKRMSLLSFKHGLSRVDGKEQRLHRIWSNIKARCLTPTHFAYKNYGGRGITICEEWLGDYMAFHRWAIGNGYAPNLTIERIEVDGNYEPGNCTWIPKSEQGKNQRTTILTQAKADRIQEFAWAGIPRKDLARTFGISKNHVTNIVNGHRWTHHKTLTIGE